MNKNKKNRIYIVITIIVVICIIALFVVVKFALFKNGKEDTKVIIEEQQIEKEDTIKTNTIVDDNSNIEIATNEELEQNINGELIILDEKMGVYNSPMADRQWVRAIYKDEKMNFYEIKNDESYKWYRIGKNEWIKDPDGSRVQIIQHPSINQNSTFTIEIVDEKMGVYNSHYSNREWLKSVYAGEQYTCYEICNDGSYIWYRIGNNEWIKDAKGTRIKTIESSSDGKIISTEKSDYLVLDCYETMLDGSSGYYYRIGKNDWIKSNNRKLLDENSNTIIINKNDYQVYHLNGYAVFYTIIGNDLYINGCDNDGLYKELSWPEQMKDEIENVYIGQDIISIGKDSFVDWKMKKVIFSGEPKILNEDSFNNCTNLRIIEYKGYGENIEKIDINEYLSKHKNAFNNCSIEEIIYS